MKMNLTAKKPKKPLIAALFALASGASLAGSVGPLTTFSAGTTAQASQVNGNFSTLSTAVNDNNARITTLEATASGGNIVLAPSTATTGNILKGTVPFLHNFGPANTFLGENAGNFTMTGPSNTAIGYQVLTSNTSGRENTAIGYRVLTSNTSGNENTAIGSQVLTSNTTGGCNTASGWSALLLNTTGICNTASGWGALLRNTTGSNNTSSGAGALAQNTTGNYNTVFGYGAGDALTTGNNNIAIGSNGIAGEANTIRIGGGYGGNQTRAFIVGIRGVTTGAADAIPVVIDSNGQLGTVSSSRRVKDDITDMGEASSTLMKLRPVTFHYKADQNPKGRSLQYGLIAEEVEKVAPNLVARSANGEIETVFYQNLTPMLLNEYQKQQRLIETQTMALAKQSARVAELEQERRQHTARIETLEKQAAHMAMVLGRLERAGMLTSASR